MRYRFIQAEKAAYPVEVLLSGPRRRPQWILRLASTPPEYPGAH